MSGISHLNAPGIGVVRYSPPYNFQPYTPPPPPPSWVVPVNAAEETVAICLQDGLADELMIEIFKNLAPRDLGACARVCTNWRRLASDSSLWRGRYFEQWSRRPTAPLAFDWKRLFEARIATEAQWRKGKPKSAKRLEGHVEGDAACIDMVDSVEAFVVVTGSSSGNVKAYDVCTLECVLTLSAHSCAVTAVKVSPKYIVSGGADGTVRVFSLGSGLLLSEFSGMTGGVSAIGFPARVDEELKRRRRVTARNTAAVIAGGGGGGDINNEGEDNEEAEEEATYSDYVVVSSREGKVVVWNCSDSVPVLTLAQAHEDGISALFVMKSVVVTASSQHVKAFSLVDGESIFEDTTPWEAEVGHYETRLATDGEHVALAWGTWVGLISSRTGGWVFNDTKVHVHDVFIDGTTLYTSLASGIVEATTFRLEPKFSLSGHTGAVYTCFADEDKVVTSGADYTIRIWSSKTGEQRKVLQGGSTALRESAAVSHFGGTWLHVNESKIVVNFGDHIKVYDFEVKIDNSE